MYYNFGGFNTVQVLEYKLEDRDLRLISYIYAVQASDYMEYIEEKGKLYFWLRNEKILEDNPTLYVNERTLNSMIANLTDKGIVDKIVRCEIGTKFKKSYYRVTDKARSMMFGNPVDPSVKKLEEQQAPEETTVNSNSNNINIKHNNIIKEVIEYLNKATNSSYRDSTPKTRTLILARIKEGFKLEDFKKVIDNKTRTWLKDTAMCKYLRPETLFGTKFESYLNEISKPKFKSEYFDGSDDI